MNKIILIFLVASAFFNVPTLHGDAGFYKPFNIVVVGEDGYPLDLSALDLPVGELDESDVEGLYLRFDAESKNLDSAPFLTTDLGDECLFGFDLRKKFEAFGNKIFGTLFLNMAGFYADERPEIGTLGQGEVHDKVRITLINGILNVRSDVMLSVQLFSFTHGGVNVHYIFRPSLGWAWDIVKSTLIKCGYISQQAEDIAFAWRCLIRDMGGINGGGKIIHYAHSIGAADTLAAKQMMTPEELAMISVVTFGSPIIFPEGGFESVVNYASVRDFVPFLRKLQVFIEEDNNIIFMGSHFGIPFIDHLLDNSTYRTVIDRLGQEFIERYVYPESEL